MLRDIDDFDKIFNKTQKMAIWGAIIAGILGIGGLGFFIWIVVKLMVHFGII
jgi:predicted permease